MQKQAHPNEHKINEVAQLKHLLTKYKTIAIIDLTNLPSPQLQKMRKKLNDVLIRVTKKSLIILALNETGKGLEKLDKVLEGNVMPALIFTNDSSFKLAKFLRRNKSQVSAKTGQVAPRDIIVSPGPTSLPAGPVIGELGAAGIKASVEAGKISIRQESTIVKEGQVIKANIADILVKLGIKPMEIGLSLIASFENGVIFNKEILNIDDKIFIDNLKLAASDALKLTVSIGYITKDNVNLVLSKVEREALALEKLANKGKDILKKELAQGDKEAEALINVIKDSDNNQEGGN